MLKNNLISIACALGLLVSCSTTSIQENDYKNILTHDDFVYETEWVDFSFKHDEYYNDGTHKIMHYEAEGYAYVDLSSSPFSGNVIFTSFAGNKYLETFDDINIPISRKKIFFKDEQLLVEETTYKNEIAHKVIKGSLDNGAMTIGSSINTDIFEDYEKHKDNFLVYQDDDFYRLLTYRSENVITNYSISKYYRSYSFEEIVYKNNSISSLTRYNIRLNDERAHNANYNDVIIRNYEFEQEVKVNEVTLDWAGVKEVLFID